MDTKILEQIEELFSEEFALVQHDLKQMEELVKAKMQLLGQGLLQRLVDKNKNGYKGSSIDCECGKSKKFVQYRSKQILTLFGCITVKRAYYRCPDCGKSLLPYDLASGLGSEQISPALAQVCCMLAVDDSFQQTSRKMEAFTGQKVSANTIERLVHHVGSETIKQQEQPFQDYFNHRQIPDSQDNPERLYIAVDGTTAHELDGWQYRNPGRGEWR